MNLGGMDNPVATPGHLLGYATCMFELTAAACRQVGLPLEVYGRRWIVEHLRELFGPRAEVFASLPPPEFLQRLRRARCLITSPGLEVLYEGFTLGIPVFVLPPQNNSQAYQAECLQQYIPQLPGPQYPELVGTPPLEPGASPTEAIRRTLEHVALLRERPLASRRLQQAIKQFLRADDGVYQALRRAQSEFIDQMRRTADLPAPTAVRDALIRTLGKWPLGAQPGEVNLQSDTVRPSSASSSSGCKGGRGEGQA